MTIAFLFPGQGSEAPRMGLALAEQSAAARELLDRASMAVDLDLSLVLRRGGRAFARTEVIQPALTAVCLGALDELTRGGLRPDVVAGHSLGEISAWCAAGCIAPMDAVGVAAERGRLMGMEAGRHPGGMRALPDCDSAGVERALHRAREHGIVDLAAHNAPTEWVVSGEEAALNALCEVARSVRLRVAGPWHSRLMAGGVEPLRDVLGARAFRPPARSAGGTPALRSPTPTPAFVANRTGRVVAHNDAIPDLLAEQLCNPIRWATTMQTLAALGVTDVVTVGPGHVLRGLIRKNLGNQVQIHAAQTPRDLDQTIEALT